MENKQKISDELKRKIILYCALHGNLVSNLPEKWVTGLPYIDSDNCVKKKKKNNGICNTRYFNYRILYDYPSYQILEINFKKLPITYSDDYGAICLDGKEYPTISTHISIFCFGFLNIDGG